MYVCKLIKPAIVYFFFINTIFSSLLYIDKALAMAEEPLVIKIRQFRENPSLDVSKEYKFQLLELILNKTKDQEGPFRIEAEKATVQSRTIEMIKQGHLSLIMTMTSHEREEELLPIRLPIYKGLYGYRVFLIRKQDQYKFNSIQNIDELKKLWAGQGHDWPDLKILKDNGFRVVGSSSYSGLFEMLQKGRFDYFPRGVHEPWKEIADHPSKDLMVEQHLVIHYPAPGYIFVSRSNIELAKRLERGFRLAIEDGSFDSFFYSHPDIVKVLDSSNLDKRLIFQIDNKLLTPLTPLDEEDLWYSP